jgi:hypothetical protein
MPPPAPAEVNQADGSREYQPNAQRNCIPEAAIWSIAINGESAIPNKQRSAE